MINQIEILYLYLNDNSLSDLSQLNNVNCSNFLDISNNKLEIENITNLKMFNSTRKVNMYGNPIKNLSGIENLTRLKMIYLDQNQTNLFQNIINSRLNDKRKKFHESLFINLIETNSFIDVDHYCNEIINFLSKNLHLNLFSHQQIDFFMHNCKLL